MAESTETRKEGIEKIESLWTGSLEGIMSSL
jgi:hypothetical protein